MAVSQRRPLALFVQLPLPPVDFAPVEGNVPLAAAYLKTFALQRGLGAQWEIELLPEAIVNRFGDRGLVDAILARRPRVVGFTCYLWNVERSLWIAEQLKRARPEIAIVVGGPEVTPDNAWLGSPSAIDHAVVGEGEEATADLLNALLAAASAGDRSPRLLHGVIDRRRPQAYIARAPLADLDLVPSPYRAGVLGLPASGSLPLETARGCRFRCGFCYYHKAQAGLRMMSDDSVAADLRWAIAAGAHEIVLLDPTLNQRPRFSSFLQLLARENATRQLAFSVELRADLLRPGEVNALAAANVGEVEIGLQSIDPCTQQRMGRVIDMPRFAANAKALVDAGIRVRTDLILGLPGDTVDSVRRGIAFLVDHGLYTEAQVFHLSLLPGTAFRQEAAAQGLDYQPRPPYHVLNTPTLTLEQMAMLMEEAEEAFGVRFDALPEPSLSWPQNDADAAWSRVVDFDRADRSPPLPAPPAIVHALLLRAGDFAQHRAAALAAIEEVVQHNPHVTLQVLLEANAATGIDPRLLDALCARLHRHASYLDRCDSVYPRREGGAKRVALVLPLAERGRTPADWIDDVTERAALVWRAAAGEPLPAEDNLLPGEFVERDRNQGIAR